MVQANFLSQSLKSYDYMSHTARALAGLPSGPEIDGFKKDVCTSFQEKLAIEIKSLREREALIKKRIEDAGGTMTQEIKQQIMWQYSLIQRAKKMLSILVENMQKTMQNIVANFR